MVACVRGKSIMDWWIGNGGGWTLLSYGMDGKAPIDASVVPAEHLEWLDNLPLMFVDEHRVFVHAGVDPEVPLDEQNPEVLQCKIYRPGTSAATRTGMWSMGMSSSRMARSSWPAAPTWTPSLGAPAASSSECSTTTSLAARSS